MGLFEMDKMDLKHKMPILLFFILYINQVSSNMSGVEVPQPEKLEVNISDGEVTVLWEHPMDAPSDLVYNVQMAKYFDQWAEVTSCTKITNTYCHLSSLIKDYSTKYKVRVQLVKGDKTSTWAQKPFLPNRSGLLPPSFNLWATSSTLTVQVHEKPILKKLFPYGVRYTIHMEEKGQDNKTTTVFLKDDNKADQRRHTFTGLQWGRKYCVSVKVETITDIFESDMSEQQCLLLPEQEFFIIAVSSLSILGFLVVVIIVSSILFCYLRRPAKTPTALKSPASGWHPLSVSEGRMEVVTDKGWFLSSYRTKVDNTAKVPVSHDAVAEDNKENRKISMDSGLSIEEDSATENEGKPPARQDDSGCGSMGGPESSSDGQTEYPLQEEEGMDVDGVRKREDSGMGMSCQLDSSSLNLDGQDAEPLMKAVIVGNDRSQSLSEVQIQVDESEDILKQIPAHPFLAEVLSGYRAGPQSCICSGVGQCSWCHKYGQHTAVCIENGLLWSKSDVTDSYGDKNTFSPYASKTHTNTVNIKDIETTFFQMSDTFPLLSSLPLTKCGQDFNMNSVSLSLCDVELMAD
ncbi:interleukin-10 receptor subunit alpha [Kryptolebias marmoratus]|uniref:Interleukin 10 receptor, alpha n=1 Tax=Kryptolebias marmoratus TaxID=37003 RepID=A0A3Q3AKM3_KRYMA|nr:interleukin-10 receptor subunit alpha [Kryptolebias marmoratus]